MFLSLIPVVLFVALFRLRNQDIELSLKILEQLPHFLIAVESLLKLPLQVFILLSKASNLGLQLCNFVVHGGTTCGIANNYTLYVIVVFGDEQKCHHI